MSLSTKEIYDKIASEFDTTRVRIWGSVKKFLTSLEPNSFLLDNGCGNGKNILYRPDLNFVGIDISDEQVNICLKKGIDAEVCSMTALSFPDNYFDNMICIASYHHLDNDLDRALSLNEMYRCIKPNGRILLTVWAKEQFEGSTFNFTSENEKVPWKSKDGNIYYRYYHIYSKGDLEKEVTRLAPKFKIEDCGYELGNWWIILAK